MRKTTLVCAVVVVALAGAPIARADPMDDGTAMVIHKPPAPPPPPPPLYRVDLLGGTHAPVDFELGARLVLLDHLIVGGSIGMTMYGGVAGQLVDTNGGGGAGSTVAALANGAFVGRLTAGYRPFEHEGLEILAAYAYLHQAVALGLDPLAMWAGAQTTGASGRIELGVHGLGVELAWTFVVLEHLLVRPSIGWMQVIDADVRTSVTSGGSSAATSIDGALEHLLTQWGMMPTVSLELGYRF
jgi:hypothetical protein